MARTKTGKDENGKSRLAALVGDRQATLATLSTLTSVLLVLTIIATLAVGYRPLAARTSAIRPQPVKVVFEWPPLRGVKQSAPPPSRPADEPRTWMPADLRAEMQQVAVRMLSSDPAETESMVRTRETLLATGWLSDARLIRDGSNTVHVLGDWRVPVAAVRCGGMDQLVTAAGELLPARYKTETSGMKVIVGVRNDPPEPGQPWLGGDVQAGLRLLEHLALLPCFDQVAGVDVSEYTPDRRLVIVTDLGNRVLWGGAPDDFNPGQASAAAKLKRLAQVYREHGRIDAGRSLLDVRLQEGVYIHDSIMATPPAKPVKTAAKTR